MITVRPYSSDDLPALSAIDAAVRSGRSFRQEDLGRWLGQVASSGQAWVIADRDIPVGFATISPVPALAGLFELDGCIVPGRQRQGLGTCLLRHILSDVDPEAVRQLSHPVSSPEAPAAQFLLKHGFFVEHAEWWMVLDDVNRLEGMSLTPELHIQTYDRQRAAGEFRHLYDSIFAGLPWNQPYMSDEEVVADMPEADELLFLLQGPETVGFAWLRWPGPTEGQIEPLGIVRAHQGRGLGRLLLAASVQRLARAGARQVSLGVWENNSRAIHLYEQAGFRRTGVLTYLAYDILPPDGPGTPGGSLTNSP